MDACSAAHMEVVKFAQDIQNSLLAQDILLALYAVHIINANTVMDILTVPAQPADVPHLIPIIVIVQTTIK